MSKIRDDFANTGTVTPDVISFHPAHLVRFLCMGINGYNAISTWCVASAIDATRSSLRSELRYGAAVSMVWDAGVETLGNVGEDSRLDTGQRA